VLLKFEKNRTLKIQFNENEKQKLREFFVNKLMCEEYKTQNLFGENYEAKVFRYVSNSIYLNNYDTFIDKLKKDLSKKLKNENFRNYIRFYDDINTELFEIDFKDKYININLGILRIADNIEITLSYFLNDIIIYIIYLMFKNLFNFIDAEMKKEIDLKIEFNEGEKQNE